MKTIGSTELAELMGWNRKKVFREAKEGNIPDSIRPPRKRGGPGLGFRFKLTPRFKKWVTENKGHSLDEFITLCERRILAEKPFQGDRWDTTLNALRRFGKVVGKRLGQWETWRGFTNERRTQVLEALWPVADFYHMNADGNSKNKTK